MLFSIDQRGQIVREGTTWKRDRDFIQEAATAKAGPQREDCKEFLLQILAEAGGGMPTSELEEQAKQFGFSYTAIKRAKSELRKEKRISFFTTGSAKDGNRTWHIKLENGGELLELPAATPVPFPPPSEI